MLARSGTPLLSCHLSLRPCLPEIERDVADALPGDWPASGGNDLRALSPARPAFATHSEPADTLGRWACMFFFFSNGLGLMGSIVISILLSLLLLYACSH